jgi:hypothetical protein
VSEEVTKIFILRTDPVEFHNQPEMLTGMVEVYLPPVPVRVADDTEIEGLSVVFHHRPLLTSFDLGDLQMPVTALIQGLVRAQQYEREVHSMIVAAAMLPESRKVVPKVDIREMLNGRVDLQAG